MRSEGPATNRRAVAAEIPNRSILAVEVLSYINLRPFLKHASLPAGRGTHARETVLEIIKKGKS